MIQLLETTLRESSPLVFVALGCLIAYQAGVYHLGVEGLMLIGAFVAVAGSIKLHSVLLGLVFALAVCAIVSALFWTVIVPLRANPIIAGIGLSGLGLGATSYALERMFGSPAAITAPTGLPRPVTGHTTGVLGILSDLSILTWLTPAAIACCWILLRRSRYGLRLAAVGDHPFAARTAGLSTGFVRLGALLLCGCLCAVGGTDFALGSLQNFSEGMTGGRGYIAFAAVLFARGNPIAVGIVCVFFGLGDALAIQTQIWGTGGLSPDFVLMLPFVLTIVAVWTSGLFGRRARGAAAGFMELRE